MNTPGLKYPSSFDKLTSQLSELEAQYVEFREQLKKKIAEAPKEWGLRDLDQVIDAIQTFKDTGDIDAFTARSFPTPLIAVRAPRRRGERGKEVPAEIREKIRAALIRGEEGIAIARQFGVAASTVSGIRKALQLIAGDIKK